MKKHLTGFLVLLAALFTVSLATGLFASAHSFTDLQEENPYGNAVQVLTSIGVIRGTSATTFTPDSPVQRWQMALLLTKLTTGNVNDNDWYVLPEGTKFSFSDIDSSQYMNAILYADEHGMIIGDGQGHFNPAGGILLQDAVTMTARALGYPRETYDSGYPQSYLELGAALGLTEGLTDLSNTDLLTRAQTAQLLFNAFHAARFPTEAGTLSENVFGCTEHTLVLTSSLDLRINPNLPYQGEDTLAFNELKPDGTFGTAYTFSTGDLNAFPGAKALLADPVSCIGASYRVTLTAGVSAVTDWKASSTIVPQSLVVTGEDTLAIGSDVYRTVTAYSYALTDGTVQASREIIVYGFGDMYATGSVITAGEMAPYTDSCAVTAYDDNGDGIPDRALFHPYSYGYLRIEGNTFTVRKPNGKTFSFDRADASIEGTVPADGTNILYFCLPLKSGRTVFRIQMAAQVASGIITDYDLSSETPSITFRTEDGASDIRYTLGAKINGAQTAQLIKLLSADTDDRYVGSRVSFALLNRTVIALSFDESALYPTLNLAAQGSGTHAVIGAVNGTYAELIFDIDNRRTVSLRSIDGVSPLSASAPSLSEYQVVSYTVADDGSYALKTVHLPVYTAADDRCSLHAEADASGKLCLILSHTAEDGEETVLASFPVSPSAEILKYTEIDGKIWLGAYLEIPKGFALYLSTGADTSDTVSFVYIRPVTLGSDVSQMPDTPVIQPDEIQTSSNVDNHFTSVVYLDGNYEKISEILYVYRGYDLDDITEEGVDATDIFATCSLPTAGYYKCRTSPNGLLYVSDMHPITGTVHNADQTLSFIRDTRLEVLSDTYFKIGTDTPILYRGAIHSAITFGDGFVPGNKYLTGPCHVLISYSAFRQIASLCQIMIGS